MKDVGGICFLQSFYVVRSRTSVLSASDDSLMSFGAFLMTGSFVPNGSIDGSDSLRLYGTLSRNGSFELSGSLRGYDSLRCVGALTSTGSFEFHGALVTGDSFH
jgi:hypothetical protein